MLGKYRDCIVPATGSTLRDLSPAASGGRRNLLAERTPLFCIAIPGAAPWTRATQPHVPPPTSPTSTCAPTLSPSKAGKGKRGRNDDDDDGSMVVDDGGSGSAGVGGPTPAVPGAGTASGSGGIPPPVPVFSFPMPASADAAVVASAHAVFGSGSDVTVSRPTNLQRTGEAGTAWGGGSSSSGVAVGGGSTASASTGVDVGSSRAVGSGVADMYRSCYPVPDETGLPCVVHVGSGLPFS